MGLKVGSQYRIVRCRDNSRFVLGDRLRIVAQGNFGYLVRVLGTSLPVGARTDTIVAFGLTQDPMLVNIYYMGLFVARALIEPEGTSVTESRTGSKTMVPGPQETEPPV